MHPLAPSRSVAAAMLDNYCQCFEAEKTKGLEVFIKKNFEPLLCPATKSMIPKVSC